MLWTFKPRLRVRARTARAGEPFQLVVVVDSPRPVPVEALRVRVVSELESNDARASVPLFVADLTPSERRIRAGRSEYPCTVLLPASLPPRIDAFFLRVRHRVEVDVDVPWGPDAHLRLELPVLPARDEGARPGGPLHGPVFEGSWEQHEHDLRVNLTIRQPLAADNLTMKLVGRAEVAGRTPTTLWTILPLPGDEGEGSARFVGLKHERRFALHPSLPGAFHTPHGGLSWTLVIGWTWFGRQQQQLEVPVELAFRGPRAGGHLRPERVEAALVAEQPLSPADEQAAHVRGLGVDDGRIVGHVFGANLVVHRELDGRRRLLVAEASFPSLELGAHLRAAAPGEHAPITSFARPVSIESARDPAQVQALCERLADTRRLELISLDDSRMRVEAYEPDHGLPGFLTDMVSLLRSLHAVRDDLPPSRVVAPYREGWEQLADSLEGTLHPASFRVTGTMGATPVEIVTIWDGPLPARTRVVLRPSGLAVEPGKRYRFVGGSGEGRAPAPMDRQLAALAEDAVGASISRDELAVELPGTASEQTLRRHLARMARVLDELRLAQVYR